MQQLYRGCYQWHTHLLRIEIHTTLDLNYWGIGVYTDEFRLLRFHILCIQFNFAPHKIWVEDNPDMPI